eukprot:CAMPEP_0196718966 /NCGR_PEP_ID=MMETSP1091-20130531/2040_1 /TAXON_ID=302021 /ORGANISM="Rhodomonas sp., Strain CCMP768" /LENGTH=165 /DNA_ID=CAMNT_0042059771 /DNA_START=30 /DNA_END=527 /DNA_ORIENTATION=-
MDANSPEFTQANAMQAFDSVDDAIASFVPDCGSLESFLFSDDKLDEFSFFSEPCSGFSSDEIPSPELSPVSASIAPPRDQVGATRGDRRVNPWSEEEHLIFLNGLMIHCSKIGQLMNANPDSKTVGLGPGVAKRIASMIGTRNATQVRSHAQKYFHSQRRKALPF